MTESEIHTLTGAYAADALPDDERSAFVEHLHTCPSCQQEVRELTATTARLATAAAVAAPPGMRNRVLAEIQHVRQVSPSIARDRRGSAAGVRARSRWSTPLAAAASLLLVLCVALAGIAVSADRRAERAEKTAASIAAVATDPSRVSMSQPVTTGGRGTVVAARGNAVFRAQGLPVLPANRSYQLWVMDDAGGARSIAVLGRGTDAHVEELVPGVRGGETIGVTVEPSGGSDRPTSAPLLAMKLPA